MQISALSWPVFFILETIECNVKGAQNREGLLVTWIASSRLILFSHSVRGNESLLSSTGESADPGGWDREAHQAAEILRMNRNRKWSRGAEKAEDRCLEPNKGWKRTLLKPAAPRPAFRPVPWTRLTLLELPSFHPQRSATANLLSGSASLSPGNVKSSPLKAQCTNFTGHLFDHRAKSYLTDKRVTGSYSEGFPSLFSDRDEAMVSVRPHPHLPSCQ